MKFGLNLLTIEFSCRQIIEITVLYPCSSIRPFSKSKWPWEQLRSTFFYSPDSSTIATLLWAEVLAPQTITRGFDAQVHYLNTTFQISYSWRRDRLSILIESYIFPTFFAENRLLTLAWNLIDIESGYRPYWKKLPLIISEQLFTSFHSSASNKH